MARLDALLEGRELREAFDAGARPRDFRGRWKKKLGQLEKAHPNVEIAASARDEGIVLSMIKTKEGARGGGLASKALDDLLAFADQHGKTVALSPEATGKGGLSSAALKKWYASKGFVANKGKHKNYAFRETMIRPPKK